MEAALREHGLQIDESLIRYCAHGGMLMEELEHSMQDWLKGQLPDAIFASSDKLTIGSLRTLRKNHIRIPEDIGLIGFSNGELTDLLDPALSVVRQPAFEMGKLAMTRLLQLVESKSQVVDFQTQVLSTELIIRKSTRT